MGGSFCVGLSLILRYVLSFKCTYKFGFAFISEIAHILFCFFGVLRTCGNFKKSERLSGAV